MSRKKLIVEYCKGKRVLDVGCGLAPEDPQRLHRIILEVALEVVGIDKDPRVLEAQGYNILHQDAEELNIKGKLLESSLSTCPILASSSIRPRNVSRIMVNSSSQPQTSNSSFVASWALIARGTWLGLLQRESLKGEFLNAIVPIFCVTLVM